MRVEFQETTKVARFPSLLDLGGVSRMTAADRGADGALEPAVEVPGLGPTIGDEGQQDSDGGANP